MEIPGLLISDIALKLNMSTPAVLMRFRRRGIQPSGYIGCMAIYKDEDVEQIMQTLPRGRASDKWGQSRQMQDTK